MLPQPSESSHSRRAGDSSTSAVHRTNSSNGVHPSFFSPGAAQTTSADATPTTNARSPVLLGTLSPMATGARLSTFHYTMPDMQVEHEQLNRLVTNRGRHAKLRNCRIITRDCECTLAREGKRSSSSQDVSHRHAAYTRLAQDNRPGTRSTSCPSYARSVFILRYSSIISNQMRRIGCRVCLTIPDERSCRRQLSRAPAKGGMVRSCASCAGHVF